MNGKPLKIILSKKGPSSECAREKLPETGVDVTAACPNHLVISDLSVGKSIGHVPVAARVKEVKATVRSSSNMTRRGQVHFCVKCNFPIAIYGRLSPCEHVFCLECALECRSESECHICGAQIQKIQKINMGKGAIFICPMPSCHKSFFEEDALKSHYGEVHGGSGSSSVGNGGDGDLHLQPLGGPLPRPRPTAQPNP